MFQTITKIYFTKMPDVQALLLNTVKDKKSL